MRPLIFEGNITRWDEALPLGNGLTGALIWGGPEDLRFSLDRTDIWDRRAPLNTTKKEFCYATLVRLARAGKTEEIREIFDAPYQSPAPTKLPAGKLRFAFRSLEGGGGLRSVLDLERAEARLQIGERGVRLFAACHALTGTGMIKATAGREDFSFVLESPAFGREGEASDKDGGPKERTISKGSLKRLRYPEPLRGEERGEPSFFWFTQKVDIAFSYGIIAGVREKEGETLIFYRIVTSRDGEDWLLKGKRLLGEELQRGYEENLKGHLDWWRAYWEKSSLSLPDTFFERQWYTANYLFGSCSRKGAYPMPLQGVWTADDGGLPPWKGDYHNDLNTQLSYTHFYKANHWEEGECFLDFLWGLLPSARKFAKKFYGTEGACLPGVMTIDGEPLGGWAMYSLSPTHQIWLCQSFELYYRYTGDRRFLEERAFPYFKETARCIGGILEKASDGFYYLPVSSSPEIHDDEAEAWVTPNSNYDLSLLRYLYQTLLEFAEILGEERAEWADILECLPEPAVDEKGALMISPDESLCESHRHFSHMTSICPLYLYDYEEAKDKAIIDASIADCERLGTGM